MINSLIDKYGTDIIVSSGETIKAYLDSQKISEFRKTNKFKLSSYLDVTVVITKEVLTSEDTYSIRGKSYRWLETLDAPTVNDNVYYCETALFEDEFINDIKLYKQSLGMSGCNLPSVEDIGYSSHKALIRTKKANDYLNYSLQGNKPITHEIVIFFDRDVTVSDLIVWGDRSFEIVALENIDEEDKFIVMSCIEVLNA